MTTPPSTLSKTITPRRDRRILVATNTAPICFAFSFVVSIVGLASAVMTSIAAAIVMGLGLSSLFVFPKMLAANPNTKWALLLASLSFVSVLWSAHPSLTSYYSTQLILTVLVGVVLASFPKPGIVLQGLFYSHLIFAILSLMFGQHVMWEDNEYVFVGLSGAKNNYGAMNFNVVLLGIYAAHQGLRERRSIFAALGVLSVIVGFAGLAYSRASGSFVSALVGIVLYFAFVGLTSLKANKRVVILLAGVVITALLVMVLSTVWTQIYNGVLEYFGKDPNLTGRVDLWVIADKIIERNYWFGVGHFAFWVQNDPLPEAIWYEMGILSRRGFNFHNAYRETMIHFGMVGFIAYVAIIGYLSLQLLRQAIFSPTLEAIVFTVLTLSTFTKIPFEAVFPLVPMSSGTIILITALALRPPRPARPSPH